jgi:putative transposase
VLHAPRFVDLAPAEVVATLLDEGTYLASERTMYRILADAGQTGERRNQLTHPRHARPELLATRPNELWSWDTTKLLGPATWTYYYLYVILDVFSRYVVGWTPRPRRTGRAGRAAARRDHRRAADPPGHPDRARRPGLVDDLQAGRVPAGRPRGHQDHSRPHVSNDNPYSEAQFKTLKYRPGFPDRFGCIHDARAFCQQFFGWYNAEHRHSGIAMTTPEAVHYGHAAQLHQARARVLAAAYAAHPERFVRRPPAPKPLPTAVWINPPESTQEATQ